MARYSPRNWLAVAVLMRESSYLILESLSNGAKTWTELRTAAKLTDGGLQKVLKELLNRNLVEQKLVKKATGFKGSKYSLTPKARKEKIFEKAKGLKDSLERINRN